jgi:hypothetical protein
MAGYQFSMGRMVLSLLIFVPALLNMSVATTIMRPGVYGQLVPERPPSSLRNGDSDQCGPASGGRA